jgi:hypothetical protein
MIAVAGKRQPSELAYEILGAAYQVTPEHILRVVRQAKKVHDPLWAWQRALDPTTVISSGGSGGKDG